MFGDMGRILANIPTVLARIGRVLTLKGRSDRFQGVLVRLLRRRSKTKPSHWSVRRSAHLRCRITSSLVFGVGVGARLGVLGLAGIEVLTRIAFAHPMFEMLSNLRVQLLIAGLACLCVLIFVQTRLVALGVVLVCISMVELAGFAFADGVDSEITADDAAVVSMMQYNVLQSNTDYDAIAGRINDEDADVVVLSETTSQHLVEITARLDTDYPYVLAQPWDDQETHVGGGMAILSTRPLDQAAVPTEASPDFRPMIAATMQVDSEEVLVVGLHLPASRSDHDKVALRELQLDTTVELVRLHRGPAVVIGDLNITPTSPLYRNLLGDLEWHDPHRTVGWRTTWSFGNVPVGLPIDHALVSNDIAFRRYDVGDGGGSDHNTLMVDIEVLGHAHRDRAADDEPTPS